MYMYIIINNNNTNNSKTSAISIIHIITIIIIIITICIGVVPRVFEETNGGCSAGANLRRISQEEAAAAAAAVFKCMAVSPAVGPPSHPPLMPPFCFYLSLIPYPSLALALSLILCVFFLFFFHLSYRSFFFLLILPRFFRSLAFLCHFVLMSPPVPSYLPIISS